MEEASSMTHPLLISRGSGSVEELKRALTNGTSGANGPNRTKSGSTELYEYYSTSFLMNEHASRCGDNLIFIFYVLVFFLIIRKPMSPPRTPVSHSSASSPLSSAGGADVSAPLARHGQFIISSPHPSQASELYYQEPHPGYDTGHFQPNCESFFK